MIYNIINYLISLILRLQLNINQSDPLYFAYSIEIHDAGLPPLISLNIIIIIYISVLIGSLIRVMQQAHFH